MVGLARLPAWLGIAGIVALAVSLQVQLDAPFGLSGVRGSPADILLIVGLIWFAGRDARALLRPSEWRLPRTWLWVAAPTIVLLLALIHGRLELGLWSDWAVLNKFAGWFALLGFALLGRAIMRSGESSVARLIEAYLWMFWLVALAHVVMFGWQHAFGFHQGLFWETLRARGFLVNPNAYGYAGVFALAMQLALLKQGQRVRFMPHWLGLALIFSALYLSSSRSAWLGGALVLLAALPLGAWRWRPMAAGAAVAIALMLIASTLGTMRLANDPVTPTDTTAASSVPTEAEIVRQLTNRMNRQEARTVGHRLALMRRALDLFLEQPTIGAGLGVFLHLETVEETRRPVVEDNVTRPAPVGIHNTGLWLLVETGVIGALVFIAFFAALAFALWRACRAEAANGAALLALLALAGFVGVSVGMEAMYNRTLWLLLGMGLALPEAARLGAFSKLATPTRKAGALGGIRTGTPAERLGLRQAKGTGPSS